MSGCFDVQPSGAPAGRSTADSPRGRRRNRSQRIEHSTTMTALAVSDRRAPSSLLFLLAVGTGAFLVFWIQPLVVKRLVPALGGSPAVWTTSLVFFQGALLAGYGLAHLLVRTLGSPSRHLLALAAVWILAFLSLPPGASLPLGEEPPAGMPPVLWLLANARPGGGSGLRCHVTRDTLRLVVARALGPSRAQRSLLPLLGVEPRKPRRSSRLSLRARAPGLGRGPAAWRTASSSWGSSGCLRSWFGLPSRTPRPISDAPSRGHCPTPDECWRSPAFPPRFSSRSPSTSRPTSPPPPFSGSRRSWSISRRSPSRSRGKPPVSHRIAGDRGHHRARRSRAARGSRAVRCLGGALGTCSGSS